MRAYDTVSDTFVAIKIIKSKKPFLQQAKTEIELLELLNRHDPHDQACIVRLLAHFLHRGHQCLVFELLSYNLYDLLRHTQFKGVSLNLIRKFARQILKTLGFLSLDEVEGPHAVPSAAICCDAMHVPAHAMHAPSPLTPRVPHGGWPLPLSAGRRDPLRPQAGKHPAAPA